MGIRKALFALMVFSLVATSSAWGQRANAPTLQDAVEQLATQDVFVEPRMAANVNVGAIQDAINRVGKGDVKVLMVPAVPRQYVQNGRENRRALGEWLLNHLGKKDAMVVVATQRGITTYTNRLSRERLTEINDQAVSKKVGADFTPAITWAISNIDQTADTAASNRSILLVSVVAVPVAIGIGIWALISGGKKRKLSAAKETTKTLRQDVVQGIGYLDNYQDMLPAGENADAVKQYRQQAEAKLQEAVRRIDAAKTPEEVDQTKRFLSLALNDIEMGKKHIDAATEGTKVAYNVTNSFTPGQTDFSQDQSIYQPVPNTCFFCSKPGEGDLTPVTMTIDGRKQTVLACPNDMAALRSGSPPQVRAMNQNGQYVPWYQVQGYDPRYHYNDRSFMWDMVGMYALFSLMNPFPFGYGWGGHTTINNYYGGDASGGAASGGDWGGSQGGSGDDWTGGGDFGSGTFDGGGDFGSGTFDGGGDFGGGDFGGDFGGGGFDGGGGGD